MNETIWMDTYRVDPKSNIVHCSASIKANGHDVHLDVIAFGYGREGTEKAFEAMEEVLPAFLGVKWQEVELVRVY
jgi:hypothetical protein